MTNIIKKIGHETIKAKTADEATQRIFNTLVNVLPLGSEIRIVTDDLERPAIEIAVGNEKSGWLLETLTCENFR